MTLREQISADFLQARKARDTSAVAFYSTLVGELERVEKESGAPATDAETQQVLRRFGKSVRELLALPNLTPERRRGAFVEMALIDSYLPKMVPEDAIRTAITEIATEAGIPISRKGMGIFMKVLNERFPNRVDGKLVSAILAEEVLV